MPSSFEISRADILRFFDDHPKRVFRYPELKQILRDMRSTWRVAESTTAEQFIAFLGRTGTLESVRLAFPSRAEIRYVRRAAPLPEVLMTLRPGCHFSQFTAMRMHDLTEQETTTYYVNFEQSPKPPPAGGLSQQGIDRAFRGRPRMARMIAVVGDARVCLLNGKHSGYLGVEDCRVAWGAAGETVNVRVTDVERTLIDIAVRPFYAGGSDEVLKAYRRAGERASANRMAAYLQKLGHVYPYHQAIGFLMEHSGRFRSTAVERFRERFAMEFDFHLDYGMTQTRYEPRWRLHVPAWM